jgi:hypothetical protein
MSRMAGLRYLVEGLLTVFAHQQRGDDGELHSAVAQWIYVCHSSCD